MNIFKKCIRTQQPDPPLPSYRVRNAYASTETHLPPPPAPSARTYFMDDPLQQYILILCFGSKYD